MVLTTSFGLEVPSVIGTVRLGEQGMTELLSLLESAHSQGLDDGFESAREDFTVPDGWFPFGSHAAYPWTGDLEFSEEKGEDGLSLWERPKYHPDHDKLGPSACPACDYDPVKVIAKTGELPPYFAPKPPINTNRLTTGESNE